MLALAKANAAFVTKRWINHVRLLFLARNCSVYASLHTSPATGTPVRVDRIFDESLAHSGGTFFVLDVCNVLLAEIA